MHALRNSSLLARLILAWFALTLGAAIASPMVNPQTLQVICSDGGIVKVITLDEDGQAVSPAHHTLDCPMCQAATLPPLPVALPLAPPEPLAHALRPVFQAHIAVLAGAPLPPRGPPVSFD